MAAVWSLGHMLSRVFLPREGLFERHADGWSSSDGGTRYRSAVGLGATAADSPRGKGYADSDPEVTSPADRLLGGTQAPAASSPA